jgi:2-dehydro-3-deoxygluconokinase
MNSLNIKQKSDCRWDFVALGEVLLRFDPIDERIHNARSFRVFDGGAEYNVARNLAKVFKQDTAIVTALAGNALGRLAEDFILQGGVDASEILWREQDDEGESTRNGLYFIERGFGLRPASSCFDRANTAVSRLKASDVDWRKIFHENGARWFHTGGVFTGLSETTPDAAKEAMRIAGDSGAIVSYDLNYRDSLWKRRGGRETANQLNREFLAYADVVFGVFDFDSKLSNFDEDVFRGAADKMLDDFPNIKAIVSTLREVHSASLHDLSGVCYFDNQIYKAKDYKNIEILDRIGSGDAFASGFVYGLLAGKDIKYSLECGTALGALAMTTPGDNSTATLAEAENLIAGSGAIIQR